MSRHSDHDGDGIADHDPTIPTPATDEEDNTPTPGVCGYPVDRTGDDWPGEAAPPRGDH